MHDPVDPVRHDVVNRPGLDVRDETVERGPGNGALERRPTDVDVDVSDLPPAPGAQLPTFRLLHVR
jgi:hypothetical protein